MSQLKEIKEGMDLGVDGYLVSPHNSFFKSARAFWS